MSATPSLFIPDPQGLQVPRLGPGEILQMPRLLLLHERPDPRNLVERYGWSDPERLQRAYVRDEVHGHFTPLRRGRLLHNQRTEVPKQQLALAWLRDHVHQDIPRNWYRLVLGHDLHLGTYATLHAHQYHATMPDPWTGKLGWWENLGLVSPYKVTVAFRDFEIDQLQAESSVYGDFKWQEVGTDNTAESNAHTALQVSTGIARVAGTQTEVAADQYRSVATVTADTTETWQEHGIFNASTGPTMMDRNLISPTVAVVASDTVQFTFTLTKTAEA